MQRDIQLLGTLSFVDDGETAVLLSSKKGCALKMANITMFAEILLPEKVSYLRIQGKRSVPQETFEVLGHKR